MVAGTTAGTACLALSHPFDTVKVRLQTAPAGTYRSALDCARRLVRESGVRGLWKGFVPPLLGNAGIQAVFFGAFGQTKLFLLRHRPAYPAGAEPERIRLTPGDAGLAGACSGVAVSALVCPVELVKCRQQTAKDGRSFVQHGWSLLRQGRIFRGFSATLAREIPACAAFFCAYETVAGFFERRGALTPPHLMLAGGLAGVGYWTVGTPPDVVKSLVQVSQTGGLAHHAAQLYRRDGVAGFFRGFAPALARNIPENVPVLAIYEFVLHQLVRLGV